MKDNLVPSVVGIGCLGYATKKGNEKEYSLWASMLHRCYDKNDKYYNNYGGKGVSVCKRWHRFDYFLEDIPKIKWYDEEKFKNGLLQLDKDIFSTDNKIYSLETCCFVNNKTNANNREYSYQKYFIAISPDGVTYKDKSIRGFARLHNLQATHISGCLKGKEKQHKGWEFYYINKEDK